MLTLENLFTKYLISGGILEEIQVVSRTGQPIRRLDSTHSTVAGQSQLLGHAKLVLYDSRKPSRIQALEG